MYFLLSILAIGAMVGTFVENDFGTLKARELIYTSFWYKTTFLFASINMLFMIVHKKLYRFKIKTMFHLSFIVILIGSCVTHYFGVDGVMKIREGFKSNIILVGDTQIKVPFFLKLDDFIITKYPGSRSPSGFSSNIVVIDKDNNVEFNTSIYMNNTLTYQGYKFFQTSYDLDELGTHLSVNKDAGVQITYIGYFLLIFGLILNLFSKDSRFRKLISKIKKLPIAVFIFGICILFTQKPLIANDADFIQKYLLDYRENSKEFSDYFSTLVVQDSVGRMKPLNTQNEEIMRKLTGDKHWNGFSPNQIMLGMLARPSIWKKVNIISVQREDIRQKLGLSKNQTLARFIDFFGVNNNYKLSIDTQKAHMTPLGKRSTYDRELIKIDERLNIFFMSYQGQLLTIFPTKDANNSKWADFKTMFLDIDDKELKRAFSSLLESIYNSSFDDIFSKIDVIKKYQQDFGLELLPSENVLQTEIWFNKISIFSKLAIVYFVLGLVLLIYSLVSIFYNKLINKNVNKVLFFIALGLFIIHTLGIAIRWYIGGYAPISNTYETMIYIAYSAIISGLFFAKRSILALSASFLISGIFMLTAHLQTIDPQITSLVPVLKSYWLSIHVSVITASYGFFAFGATLGLVTLILIILKNKTINNIDLYVKNITYINEVALIFGLTLLITGTLLGGVWANESWGRYWGWDPKETWAYISILIYAMVLHVRFFQNLYSPFLFSSLSLVSFSSILMTYYGVNFYLSGMHSYAKGDPIPIPQWVYISLISILSLILLAYFRKGKK